MSWVGKKIHLYNVTMGLYMLDWWERCLFSILPPRLYPIQFLYYCPLCKFRPCFARHRHQLGAYVRSASDSGLMLGLGRHLLDSILREMFYRLGNSLVPRGSPAFLRICWARFLVGCSFRSNQTLCYCYWNVLPLTRVDILVLILLWFICFNGSRFATDVFERYPNKQSIDYFFLALLELCKFPNREVGNRNLSVFPKQSENCNMVSDIFLVYVIWALAEYFLLGNRFLVLLNWL